MSVLLLSNDARLRKTVKAALGTIKVTARKVTPQTQPVRADAVVSTVALNSTVERLASRVGCGGVYILPEADAALARFVAIRGSKGCGPRGQVVLVGHDVASEGRVFAASSSAKQLEVEL